MRTPWPFIGRGAELTACAAALRSGGGVVVYGAAGVGTTRLANEAVGRLRRGTPVVRVHAEPSMTAVPLAAFTPHLRPEPGATTASHMATLINSIGAERPRPVLLVDAVQYLDPESATVVRELALRNRTMSIITARSGADVPSAIVDLWRGGTLRRIDLEPLARHEAIAMLEQAVGGPLDGLVARQLWHTSGGNVGLMGEMLTAALETRSLQPVNGIWQLTGELPLTDRLVDTVKLRFDPLTETERYSLELLALASPVRFEWVDDLIDRATLERLETLGLIAVTRNHHRSIRLTHPLDGEVLRTNTPTVRLDAHVKRLFTTLEQVADGDARDAIARMAAVVAPLGVELPARLLVEGAEATRADGGYDAAIELAESAVAAGAGADAALLLADVLTLHGRFDDAVTALESIDRVSLDGPDAMRLTKRLASTHFWFRGDATTARAIVAEVVAGLPDGDERHVLTCFAAAWNALGGEVESTLAVCEPWFGTPGVVGAEAVIAAAPALVGAGRAETAHRRLEVVLAAAGNEPVDQAGLFVIARCLAASELGMMDETIAVALSGADAATSDGSINGRAWLTLIAGRSCWLSDLGSAIRWFVESASLWERGGCEGAARWALGGLALAASWAGEAAAAAEALSRLDRLDGRHMSLMESDVMRAIAWSELAAGAPDEQVINGLEAARRTAADRQLFGLELAALHDLARLNHADLAIERSSEIGHLVEGPLASLRVDHIAAASTEDSISLEQCADGFEGLGQWVVAAECYAASAAAARRTGDRLRARRMSARARRAAENAGGVKTPAMLGATEATELTVRETEVARLAQLGLSSAEIADRLVLSRRTVDNHLHRVFRKLGVDRRSQLADALGGE